MDDKNTSNEPVSSPPPGAQQDVQHAMKWMAEYGRPALIGLVIVVVVMLGVSIWRGQQQDKAAAAVQALFQGRAPEEFQQMAAADPKAPTAPLALATAAAEFYAAGRYDEALSAYQRFLGEYPDHMLAEDAQVGVAASLEALDDFAGAADAYESFAEARVDSALAPQAVMGAARCREQLGQYDAARALYEDFIVAHPDSTWVPQAESGLLFLKKAERASREPAATEPEAQVVFDSSVDAAVVEEAEGVAPEEAAPAAETVEVMESTEELPAVVEEEVVETPAE